MYERDEDKDEDKDEDEEKQQLMGQKLVELLKEECEDMRA